MYRLCHMTLWIQIVCRICWGRFRDPAGHSQQPSLAPLKDPWKSVKELNTVAHAACRWRCSSSCMASRLCCSNLATALCGTKCWVQLVIALLLWVSAATWPGATSSTLRIRRSSAVMQLSSNSLIGIETGEQNIQQGMGELFGPLWACLNHAFAMWQRQTWGLEKKRTPSSPQ